MTALWEGIETLCYFPLGWDLSFGLFRGEREEQWVAVGLVGRQGAEEGGSKSFCRGWAKKEMERTLHFQMGVFFCFLFCFFFPLHHKNRSSGGGGVERKTHACTPAGAGVGRKQAAPALLKGHGGETMCGS
jgi:hypothetical protein